MANKAWTFCEYDLSGWEPLADPDKPELPYRPGLHLSIRRHMPIPPFGRYYSSKKPARRENSLKERCYTKLSDWALRYPPSNESLPHPDPSVCDLEVLDAIACKDGRGAQLGIPPIVHQQNYIMSARLEEHMRIRRQFQACGAKKLGPILPDRILDQFTAAVTADDRDAVRALLDTHFPDRTQLFPGQYNIHELFPVISQAARNDQADVLKELFVPYPFPYQSTDFVAREAIDTGSEHILLLLLEYGWDINQRIDAGPNVLETLLHLGAQDRDMVRWLIAHGASLNERPPYIDITGMSQAVEHTSLDLVRELADEYGGDVHRGQLLHYALKRKSRTQSGTQSVAAASDIVEMLGLLLERGAPLNITLYADDEVSSHKYRNSDHGTPLHEAAQMGHVEAVQYLLAQGADTSIISTRSKTTALAWAEKAGHEDVVAMLRSPDQYKL